MTSTNISQPPLTFQTFNGLNQQAFFDRFNEIRQSVLDKNWRQFKILLENASPAATDDTGKTALMYAAVYLQVNGNSSEDTLFLERLLEKSPNMQHRCHSGMKAIQYAAVNANHQSVLFLLERSNHFDEDCNDVFEIYSRMNVLSDITFTDVKRVCEVLYTQYQSRVGPRLSGFRYEVQGDQSRTLHVTIEKLITLLQKNIEGKHKITPRHVSIEVID